MVELLGNKEILLFLELFFLFGYPATSFFVER